MLSRRPCVQGMFINAVAKIKHREQNVKCTIANQ